MSRCSAILKIVKYMQSIINSVIFFLKLMLKVIPNVQRQNWEHTSKNQMNSLQYT